MNKAKMNQREWLKLIEEFRSALDKAASQRSERLDSVMDYTGPEPKTELGWVLYEREQMLVTVNVVRVRLGLPLVDLRDVKEVEQFAVGHSDYGDKFALYCAELAVGKVDIQP